MSNPQVTFYLSNGKSFVVELYPEIAPNTVNNFLSLVDNGFYDGLIFHRVIENFMIQGGCPNGTGMGGPGYAIKGEFLSNGFDNDLKHTAGVLSMARSQAYNSAGSQFFVMHKDSPHLDGEYSAFGKVIEGMNVVDEIATCETGMQDRPLEDIVMEEVTITQIDDELQEPEIM
ncbi:MAG: peptidylprolyl isomerase [Lachnospirales bacterium]